MVRTTRVLKFALKLDQARGMLNEMAPTRNAA